MSRNEYSYRFRVSLFKYSKHICLYNNLSIEDEKPPKYDPITLKIGQFLNETMDIKTSWRLAELQQTIACNS